MRSYAAMGLILATFFALGVMFISVFDSRLNLEAFLFGDMLSVTPVDVWQTALITGVVLVLVRLLYKELLFYNFDPLGAKAMGLPTEWLQRGLTAAYTLAIISRWGPLLTGLPIQPQPGTTHPATALGQPLIRPAAPASTCCTYPTNGIIVSQQNLSRVIYGRTMTS
ncbi:putative ABC transporter protein [Halomicronema hongdechloris C2206]|uniref:ABC transporter protein n=1 Tax=Halomicronema hongdechloris C2206 TaxID=1641165 RepID=A0A1Z3HQ84_9CYAN|nr:metal ABC transporter permease [Halomicronema hongdechloris]ASC72455.1 putative ABC transporter protein [Halomicronema hongdechloris C2206]